MKVIKIAFVIFVLIMSAGYAGAQYENPEGEIAASDEGKTKKHSKYAQSKFFFGGNLGLSFGTYTYIEVAPLIGYKITPRLWAGLGPKYMYEKYKPYYETSTYGLKIFASFTVIKDISETINIGLGDIFFYAENENINAEIYSYPPSGGAYSEGRQWFNVMLIGGGMRFPIGGRSGFSLMVLWDITQNPYYSYSNPEIRIVFDF